MLNKKNYINELTQLKETYFCSLERKYGFSLIRYLINYTPGKLDDWLNNVTLCVVGGDIKVIHGSYTEEELFELSSVGDYVIVKPEYLPDPTKGTDIVRRCRFGDTGRMLFEDALKAGFNSRKCWLSLYFVLVNSLHLQVVQDNCKTYVYYNVWYNYLLNFEIYSDL